MDEGRVYLWRRIMSKQGVVISLAAAISMTLAGLANAAVSPEEAARLGQDLTCVGAERAGNADGSIPEFKGTYVGEVPGWRSEERRVGKEWRAGRSALQ